LLPPIRFGGSRQQHEHLRRRHRSPLRFLKLCALLIRPVNGGLDFVRRQVRVALLQSLV
jgi:hypothetical protein